MTRIISIDWAIKKPLYYYDGIEIKTTHNPNDIKSDIILIEVGAPYSLIAQLSQNNSKILMISGEETKKYRDSKQIPKSDENDAICIFNLYSENHNLFTEIEQRSISDNKLKYLIKMYYSLLQSNIKLKNESKALEKEYIVSDVYKENIKNIEVITNKYRRDLIKLSSELYKREFISLKNINGFGEQNISIFIALVDIRKFTNFKKFLKYCGFSPTKETETIKNVNKYNRIIKNLIGTTVISIILHKVEPYYSLYKIYKDKKLKELKIKEGEKKGLKGYADTLARRKISQKLLKNIWKELREISIHNERESKTMALF